MKHLNVEHKEHYERLKDELWSRVCQGKITLEENNTLLEKWKAEHTK